MQKIPSHIKYEDALDALNIIEWRITASCTSLDEFKIHFFKKVNDEFTQDESLFGFTYQDVENKYKELKDAEPMRLLRLERNRLLQETDWMANSDVVMTDAWKTYRQALRDLPTTATPEINEYGELINITWPEKPNG
jgi:hypothetical protein